MDAEQELLDLAYQVREGVGRLTWRMRVETQGEGQPRLVLAVLSRLYRGGTHTPKALADAERIHPQSLTRVLASLVDDGLVTRKPDPADGRQSLVDITPAGLSALRKYSVDRERWLAGAMDAVLSPTERELLRLASTLLAKVADA
ncbi:MarR family winged helix-turn-helix transcriptional regulator [Amycolatopsis sp. CA-230715]|uniref:MarR family winged helix-turn-helix transcriptional regulator n=1 Tax=Amycolatopsis sp. CA-230715 TaxID=2745196 RepID=UPI001C33B4BD|nr:MarR family transcriptional regulator [Amycolatopsis sp. CA-230715]QWF82935.1 putative HTH-type transcriptional regulator [Amycolatopsis sp. CA-230715]